MTDDRKTVLLGMPLHNSQADMRAMKALHGPTRKPEDLAATPLVRTSSLLARGFNELWCAALNGGYDYFAMLHGDISPVDGWLDILLEEMEATGADVVSAVSPIKSSHGLTSTAIDDPDNKWIVERRLTMKEVMELPETFDASDTDFPERALLVNTGCWIADLSKSWCRELDENDEAVFHFTINDRIRYDKASKMFVQSCEPEDWFMSRILHRKGAKVVATRKVQLNHYGSYAYPNYSTWGELDEDFIVTMKARPISTGPCTTDDGREIIFIHSPKTAGTSIWTRIGRIPGVGGLVTHNSVHAWREVGGDERYDAAFKFSVVRNPYDKLLSAWTRYTTMGPDNPYWESERDHRNYVFQMSGPEVSFERFVMNFSLRHEISHFVPQCSWLANEQGKLDVDHIIRFENLTEDWAAMCKELPLSVDALPHENKTDHAEWQDVYTPEMIERVNELYSMDFDNLGYDRVNTETLRLTEAAL